MLNIMVAVFVVVGVLVAFLGLNSLLVGDTDIQARMGRFASRANAIRERSRRKPDRSEALLTASLNKVIAKQSFAQNMSRELARADLKITVGEYLVINLLATVFGMLIGYLAGGRSMIFAMLGVVAGFFAPRLYLRRRQKARLKAFNDQLADTISMLANSLRSGYSLLQSMDMVSREAPAPTSDEFKRVVREVGLGLSPEEALANLVRRINSEDLDLMVTAINVQHEVGGNLSQILESIGTTIRERVRIKGEIASLTAQQQYSGYILAAIPILLAGVLFMINREYMMPMFQGIFLCMPIGGGIMIIIGFLIIRKIVAIEV